MTIRTATTRRGVLTITDDVPQVRGRGQSVPSTLVVAVTDYKGDLPLNPQPWCRLDVVEHSTGKRGENLERRVTVMLNEENRAALLAYLNG